MRRAIRALFTGVLSIILLSGCTPKDTRTHLQFSSWGSKSELEILEPILEEFEKENPEIKIDFMHIPQNYFQKLHLLFASNTVPDVIFINNLYLPIYADAGKLEDLTDYNLTDEDFYPKATEALSRNGKIYGIPRDVSNLVIFYNKEIFDKNHPTQMPIQQLPNFWSLPKKQQIKQMVFME